MALGRNKMHSMHLFVQCKLNSHVYIAFSPWSRDVQQQRLKHSLRTRTMAKPLVGVTNSHCRFTRSALPINRLGKMKAKHHTNPARSLEVRNIQFEILSGILYGHTRQRRKIMIVILPTDKICNLSLMNIRSWFLALLGFSI